MSILKELWTKEIQDPDVKSTYQYVIDLRERLETTCKLARDNLEKAPNGIGFITIARPNTEI